MHKECLICVLIVSIGVSCSAWSQEEKKHFSDIRPATTIVEERIAIRESDEVKVTSNPLQIKNDDTTDGDNKNQKKLRPTSGYSHEIKGPECCGPNNGPSRSEGVRKSSSENERDKYPRYGPYPDEGRFSWQSSNHPSEYEDNGGRPGSYRGPYAGSESYSERFKKPQYGNENNKGNLNFGGLDKFSGKFGSILNNKFGFANKFGIGNKFGYYGDGEYGRPGYQENTDLANQESGFGGDNTPQPPANFATQQAVALKALAGVALIGAAAALATNPVLLPISAIAGRRKRDLEDQFNKELSNFPSKILKNYATKIPGNNNGPDLSITPQCVARLACEIQKDYITDLKKNKDILKEDKNSFHDMERWFMSLIQKNILDADYVDGSMKKLIKLATLVGSEGRDCTMFICSNVKT
ncbi:uncharacterized protein LOC127277991 [Leptopilina boulardi]|uniref:uncharacterized protein LOC127277991 n=1 Tax=Leptopilina boulardi TaxID=63433 RepID=UPI0021F5F1DF|nr:uncharacterized protein LOC127277991 [Leptopilina boulardi]